MNLINIIVGIGIVFILILMIYMLLFSLYRAVKLIINYFIVPLYTLTIKLYKLCKRKKH
jgi:hypothetical protein